MKTFLILLTIFFISISSFAQQGINYKALIKDDLGNALIGQTIDIRFTLKFDTIEFGTITQYEETHTTTTDNNGIIILAIGNGVVQSGSFPINSWNYGTYLTIEIDIERDGTYVNFGITQFEFVPKAIQARSADLARTSRYVTSSGSSSNFSNTNSMGNGTKAISLYQTLVGTFNESNLDLLFAVGNGISDSNRNNALMVLKDGTITAPSFSILEISNAGNKALVTKEYADVNYLNANENVTTVGSLTIQNISDATSFWRLETRPNGSLSLYRNGDYRGFFSESTGNYSSISDRHTKKDITALENGTLNKVMHLNPVSYLMKDQTNTNRNLGLISQEVQEIFPNLTHYVEESDLLTLSYTELIPILIKALQEQQEIIEAQNAKDTVQDKSIEALVARLNLMDSKLSN